MIGRCFTIIYRLVVRRAPICRLERTDTLPRQITVRWLFGKGFALWSLRERKGQVEGEAEINRNVRLWSGADFVVYSPGVEPPQGKDASLVVVTSIFPFLSFQYKKLDFFKNLVRILYQNFKKTYFGQYKVKKTNG